MTDLWEARHHQVYSEGSWIRVQRLTWMLMKRGIGWDPGDIEKIEQDGGVIIDPPEARKERLERWIPAARLLALAVWRAARDADLLVDDVPLDRPLWWLGGARHAELYIDPLPSWEPPLDGDWTQVQQREELLLESARWVATWHVMQDIQENRALADSADGTPAVPLLLGDRCRALISGPYRDGHRPRWAGTVEYAEVQLAGALEQLRARRWLPGPVACHAAAALHPSLTAAPDAPLPPDEVKGVTWIQRVVRMAHLYGTIGAVLAHHGVSGELDPHPRHPFGWALGATKVALGEIEPTVGELEELWARRDSSVALWERAHFPVAVREHIRALENMITCLSELCFYMNVDPDEAH
ncbi:hypothetical protein [Streptomyces sp. TLI_146]|uniref:hypothetical protein n=1 Tax=Streptomyces sp. TLI_146 TaxID=1938858 RepID=UPI000CB31569|nr:hypothetical protein [Streptomyces sp. TLI_146]PKV84241.1 hypothetical protein BX283_1753 [Streptomyces sp. TLI_146]